MSELKPCPFCGEQPELTTYFIKGTANHTNVYASCSCGHKTRSRKGVDGAIADWNTRPIEDELRKRIAELEAAQRWRVVADGELPDDEDVKTVLVVINDKFDRFDSGNTVARLTYLGDGKWWSWESVRYVVTHWMPLPELPEVQE